MSTPQTYALISLILSAGLIYWLGYRNGLTESASIAAANVQAIRSAEESEAVRNLQRLLNQAYADRKKMHDGYERARAASQLGRQEHQTLVEIAEQLQLAADTFRALRSPEQSRKNGELRAKALSIAALLVPVAQGRAA